jgi:hypothetical protein
MVLFLVTFSLLRGYLSWVWGDSGEGPTRLGLSDFGWATSGVMVFLWIGLEDAGRECRSDWRGWLSNGGRRENA